jgi:hypothetical protein
VDCPTNWRWTCPSGQVFPTGRVGRKISVVLRSSPLLATFATAIALAPSGCSKTQVLVEVDSDLTRVEANTLVFTVASSAQDEQTRSRPFEVPISFGVADGRGDGAPVRIIVEAKNGETTLATAERIVTRFVDGETRTIRVFLARACSCASDTNCGPCGVCTPKLADLSEDEPPILCSTDAGTKDGGIEDSTSADAKRDAGFLDADLDAGLLDAELDAATDAEPLDTGDADTGGGDLADTGIVDTGAPDTGVDAGECAFQPDRTRCSGELDCTGRVRELNRGSTVSCVEAVGSIYGQCASGVCRAPQFEDCYLAGSRSILSCDWECARDSSVLNSVCAVGNVWPQDADELCYTAQTTQSCNQYECTSSQSAATATRYRCDAQGRCVVGAGTQSCGYFECDQMTGCLTSCSGNIDCVLDAQCVVNSCVPD